MLKRLFLFPLAILLHLNAAAQGSAPALSRYHSVVKFIEDEWGTIGYNGHCNLVVGEACHSTYTFYKGTTYLIIAVTDDDNADSLAIDLHITADSIVHGNEYNDHSIYLKFSPATTGEFKFYWKYNTAKAQGKESLVHLIIGYR